MPSIHSLHDLQKLKQQALNGLPHVESPNTDVSEVSIKSLNNSNSTTLKRQPILADKNNAEPKPLDEETALPHLESQLQAINKKIGETHKDWRNASHGEMQSTLGQIEDRLDSAHQAARKGSDAKKKLTAALPYLAGARALAAGLLTVLASAPPKPKITLTPKGEPEEPKVEYRPEEADVKSQRSGSAPVSAQPKVATTSFVDEKKFPDITYPLRPGAEITLLPNGQDFFRELAKSILSAKKSVDIICWGIDTDIKLERRSEPPEENHISRHAVIKPICPAAPQFVCAVIQGGQCPYESQTKSAMSLKLSDLLACAAYRKIKVSLLIWAPFGTVKNVWDPVHFWWRCKTGEIPNVEFAFRDFLGESSAKGERPKLMVKDELLFGRDEVEFGGGKPRERDERIDDVLRREKKLYNLLYSHHQKLALIDLEAPARAHGYVMGFNVKEEYWDDSEHKADNPCRRPYQPWRDAGLRVRGPVLHDIARNFKDNWAQMISQKAEIFPNTFVCDALAAGCSKPGGPYAENTKAFDKERYEGATSGVGGRKMSLPGWRFWEFQPKPWCLSYCAFLTELIALINGILSGSFDFKQPARPALAWGRSILSPDAYILPSLGKESESTKAEQPVQFLRTFSVQGAPKDFSIRRAYKRALSSVQNGQLIYVENQYFRDPFFAQDIINLYNGKTGSAQSASEPSDGFVPTAGPAEPYLIIVTNPLSNEKREPLSFEAKFAEEPTHMVYESLKHRGVKMHLCWLRVLEKSPPSYKNVRKPDLAKMLIDFLTEEKRAGADLSGLRTIALKLRDTLYYRVYSRLSGDTSLLGFARGMDMIGAPLDAISKWLEEYLEEYITKIIEQASKGGDIMVSGFVVELERYMVQAQSTIETVLGILPGGSNDPVPPGNPDETAQVILEEYKKVYKDYEDRWEERTTPEYEQKLREIDGAIARCESDLEQAEERIRYIDRKLQSGSVDFLDSVALQAEKLKLQTTILKLEGELFILRTRREYYNKQAYPEEKSGELPGHIYVHSKVMTVDSAHAILGSANINERSMWHDTESALAIHANGKNSTPAELRDALINIVLRGKVPDKTGDPKRDTFLLFKKFENELTANDAVYGNGKPSGPLGSHVLTLEPKARPLGSAPIS